MAERSPAPRAPAGTVAYLLKGYPRLSEIFIASEIHRLERAGLPIRLYVIKQPDERVRHPVVDRIRAQPSYLPPATPVSDTSLLRWLRTNLRPFLPSLAATLRRRPGGLLRAALAALAQAVRAREGRWAWPRTVYLKELLQAVALSERLLAAPDVVHLHAHFAHGCTTVAWLASLITGLPFSFTGHAKDIYAERLNPAGLLRRKLLAARFAVTCTEANRRHLERIAPQAEVHRVYHGLNADFSRLLDGGAPARSRNGSMRVLGVGRLVAKKGFDVLVDACALLEQRGIGFEATIVGEEGDHGDEVRRRIVDRGLSDRVALAGPRTQAQLLEDYRRADAVCLPCRIVQGGDRDGIPNVLVEAMACGVPAVSTAISGIPELIEDGRNGLLVAPDDPEAVAAALIRIDGDRELAQRLGRAARETVSERFDGDRLTDRLTELFGAARA
ncbi:MAG: glycosyltransferase family 4 protein [Solirubrobacterales bacterium]